MKILLLFFISLASTKVNASTTASPQSHFTAPAATLVCSETGYTIQVDFSSYPSSTSHVGSITIGPTEGVSGCEDTGIAINQALGVIHDYNSGNDNAYEESDAATCGGSIANDNDTHIVYTVDMFVDVVETISTISRTYRYKFALTCTLDRVQTVTDGVTFTVSSSLVLEDEETTESDEFTLGMELKFLDAGVPRTTTFIVNNREMINVAVAETGVIGGGTGNEDFKFTVQKCFTHSGAADTSGFDFIDEECPLDRTVTHTPGGFDQNRFDFSIRAFNLVGQEGNPVYISCEIYICRNQTDNSAYDDNCIQDTDCAAVTRKRRSVEEDAFRRKALISSPFPIQIALSGVRCPNNFVYDSILDECTNERLLRINGVYLDIPWSPAYANISSMDFKRFARTFESHLEALILTSNKQSIIRGLRIVKARKGSVILDVIVTYAESVDAGSAFQVFEDVMYKTTAQMTRIANLLNIRKDKVIEFVPILATTADSGRVNMELILIVVIVAAVLLIALLAGMLFYRLQQTRPEVTSNPRVAIPNVYENKAMENI